MNGRMTVKFVHTSDWQLGMTWRVLQTNAEAQPRFDQDRIDAVARLADLDAQFVVVAGDVFHDNSVTATVRTRAWEAMRSIGKPVFLLPGNHDAYDAGSIYRRHQAEIPDNVTILTDDTPVTHADLPNVEIVGAPFLSRYPHTEPVADALAKLEPAAPGITRVLVGHGTVYGFGGDTGNIIDVELVEAALADGRVHYVGIGDKHSTESIGSSGRFWYSGAIETTDYEEKEPDSGNALLVEISADECDVQSVPMGKWRFRNVQAHLNTDEDIDRFFAELDAMPDKARTTVKYDLVGSVTLAQNRRLEQGLEHRLPTFAACYPRERTKDFVVLPDEGELAGLGLTGYTLAAAEELQELSESGDQTAADALALLYRLEVGVN